MTPTARITILALAAIFGGVIAIAVADIADDGDDGSTAQTVPATGTIAAPDCATVFDPGRPTADVVADTDSPCMDGDGLLLATRISWDCPDGTKVHQVQDFGWGRDGDVWQAADVPAPYADCVMPGTDANHP